MSIKLENLKNKAKKSTATALLEDNNPNIREPEKPQKEAAIADQESIEFVGELPGTSTTEKIGRQSNKMFEDEFIRQTFYVHKDLLKEINKLAKNKKGVKTKIINAALETYLKNMS